MDMQAASGKERAYMHVQRVKGYFIHGISKQARRYPQIVLCYHMSYLKTPRHTLKDLETSKIQIPPSNMTDRTEESPISPKCK